MAGPAPAIAAEDSNLFPSFLPTPFPLPLSQHKSCFPETQEKVRHLKRKNAELAVIAKRLEERARKLQEANLKVVSTPDGSCAGLCKKALARQRAMDLREQASVLLAKDKQINALQQECQDLQAKITSGKEASSPCLPLLDFRHLLQESQKEVLRLQRQIALKNFKASLGSHSQGSGDASLASVMGMGSPAPALPAYSNGFSPSRVSRQRNVLSSAVEAVRKESELRRKRKQCENLEHEVRKKHKRCAELDACALPLSNLSSLPGQVESENADLRLQVAVVTEERDSALQKTQELQNRLESLGQALKHMRDVAERRQQLEQEHERALQALQKKQEEVRQLQQAQAEARKEHEGAVQLLELSLFLNFPPPQARVRELEEQCHSHTEQFNFLSQELKQFRLQTEKISLPPSSQVTSEVTFTTCQTSLQLLEGLKEKGDYGERGSPLFAFICKMVRKLESQSSSSRSESMQNSPKSCPTPEVDTASEMEELDIDTISLIPEPENQGPVKLRVFLARYSYNPFAGPNENPEAELPLTAGEYIYVYGEMDEDGFFEGELMDGRRGLVPSNFVERVSDEDLVTFLPQELHDLSQSSPLERSSLSTSLSSAERSDCSTEELSASTAPSRLEEDEGERASLVVPYPRKVTLIKQFGSSLLVGWEPPLPTPGSSEIQSYNLYVDSELRQTVKAGSQTKAVVERLDLKTRTYRLSVQSVSEAGSSDRLRCTFLAGGGFAVAPTQLRVRSVAATSAQISWVPSNSNFPHTVYLNGEEHEAAKAGVYWYTFRNLNPSTSYVATVEVQPQQQALGEPAPEKQDQPLSAEIQFTTASAGSPDAPLDVRVEAGPSPGILVISWLPVTIDAEGSSNGVRVTGYAVYADGQKVMEVTSPTAGSVLAEISQLQILQVCQEVSVRTVSLYGESVDSVPAQIPLALLGDATSCSSPLEFGGPAVVQLPGREGRDVLTSQTSQACGTEDTPAAAATDSFAKSTSQPSVSRKKSGSALLAETSPKGSTSPTGAALTHVPQGSPPEMGPLPRGEGNAFAPVTEGNPAMLRKESEEEKRSDAGNRPVTLLTDHSRGSDLSDIMEEEEEEEEEASQPSGKAGESKWAPSECPGRENGEKLDLGDTDSDEEILERILEMPLQKNCSKALFSIPESSDGFRDREGVSEMPAYPGNWEWDCPEIAVERKSSQWGRPSRCREKGLAPSQGNRKRKVDIQERPTRSMLSSSHQGGGGLYRARSLKENLDVITSLGVEDKSDLCSWARQRPRQRRTVPLEAAGEEDGPGSLSRCLSPESLEINVEYDSDEDMTITSTPASQLSLDGRADGSPTDCEEGWSDSSSRSGSVQSSGPREVGNGARPPAAHPGGSAGGGGPPRVPLRRGAGAWRGTPLSGEAGWSARLFVALFDYDPPSMSPNPDAAEEELPFQEGQILKVYGHKDADGFYRGKCGGRTGYVPCNMVSEVQVDSEATRKQLLEEGRIPTDMLVESLGAPPCPLTSGWDGEPQVQAQISEDDAPRTMVAIFDYNPKENSPNLDMEAELRFCAGDIVTVFSSMDDDGFYYVSTASLLFIQTVQALNDVSE
uniref:TSPO associated protein 1 n=1 Tax=Podarcis muralis TaxID=64176 RepID=A0A670KCK3_PODMU